MIPIKVGWLFRTSRRVPRPLGPLPPQPLFPQARALRVSPFLCSSVAPAPSSRSLFVPLSHLSGYSDPAARLPSFAFAPPVHPAWTWQMQWSTEGAGEPGGAVSGQVVHRVSEQRASSRDWSTNVISDSLLSLSGIASTHKHWGLHRPSSTSGANVRISSWRSASVALASFNARFLSSLRNRSSSFEEAVTSGASSDTIILTYLSLAFCSRY